MPWQQTRIEGGPGKTTSKTAALAKMMIVSGATEDGEFIEVGCPSFGGQRTP
ncbi:hypothetical protein HLB44_36255 [Aquincola sp. S2]|uniref:Uncharacterized protein n=1 Tax=Pseudaquabacterium terrae TaxID=2732868 RepID=A0ABX2EUR5_9BURK|nr:hypothetical protein [Aquabacterium terrae]NRF72418.1 hypothetical protein [Aquabacterium terrae]